MPDFPIVDTHVHLWDPPSGHIQYPWLVGSRPLNRRFLLDEYRRACGPVIVEKIVFVQCGPRPEDDEKEAQWVSSLAATEDARIQGIVAGAQIELGDGIRPALERLAGNPRVKGIRRITQSESDPAFCLRPDFLRGIRMLAELGLSFDLCINPTQLPNTIRLVDQCPDVPFILDHIGKPDIRGHRMEPWRTSVRDLARRPHVWCKISGLATEADHQAWTRDDLQPYIACVIESFGFDRVMYGSDWPVATLATDYPRWVEALDWAVRGCSATEHRKLFRDNAIQFYRL